MERIVERCAFLDVHRDTVMACARTPDGDGRREEVVQFATTTSQCPSVGRAWARERRQGHRTSQLQLSKYSPLICQVGCVIAAPDSGLTLKAPRPIVSETMPAIKASI